MRIVLDIETNRLINPDRVWVIVCYDIDKEEYHVFRHVTDDEEEAERFRRFSQGCTLVVGHNLLGYDAPVLDTLCGIYFDVQQTLDTLIISKMVDYSRKGHSVEDYGLEFGYEKIKHQDFTKYSQELEDYCTRDVDITYGIYLKHLKYIDNLKYKDAITYEHRFQGIVNNLSLNGFSFNKDKANTLLTKVLKDLSILDVQILDAFPPKLKLIREVMPKETKHGTISLSSIPKLLRQDILSMSVGAPFCYCSWVDFNPSSHKQIIEVLNEAGWSPVVKTETHKEVERELSKLRHTRRDEALDIRYQELYTKYNQLRITGWKICEDNLETLPLSAPPAARLLAKRILLESRRRTLTEWLALTSTDNRIHGKFYGLGAWTHRMAHRQPNTANIPLEFDTAGNKKLYGKELRSLWQAPKNRLLIGVDAEGIQLRIFAHLIDDPEFTEALVKGKKDDKTDPHSLNRRILGDVCKSRQVAKRYIYALLLGAGKGKLQEILESDEASAAEAYERLLQRYTGFAYLKNTIIPADAKRGWFTGIDGRPVKIPSETFGGRKHLAMSGYLQNGEAVVMKRATLMWHDKLKDYDALLVNLVHDEWQVECPNNMSTALSIAEMMASSLKEVGQDLKLRCPLAGSYWNDDLKDYTIATNWSKTH